MPETSRYYLQDKDRSTLAGPYSISELARRFEARELDEETLVGGSEKGPFRAAKEWATLSPLIPVRRKWALKEAPGNGPASAQAASTIAEEEGDYIEDYRQADAQRRAEALGQPVPQTASPNQKVSIEAILEENTRLQAILPEREKPLEISYRKTPWGEYLGLQTVPLVIVLAGLFMFGLSNPIATTFLLSFAVIWSLGTAYVIFVVMR